MPDLPTLLQSFVWQKLDVALRFLELKVFLDFWENALDGKLLSVRVANTQLIKPAEVRLADGEFHNH